MDFNNQCENEKMNKFLDLVRKLKETVEHESDGGLKRIPESLEKRLVELEIRGRIETIQIC